MPELPAQPAIEAFLQFFNIGIVGWGLTVLVGIALAAFAARMIIGAFWR